MEKKISSKINYDVLRDLEKVWQGGVSESTATPSGEKEANNDRNTSVIFSSGKLV